MPMCSVISWLQGCQLNTQVFCYKLTPRLLKANEIICLLTERLRCLTQAPPSTTKQHLAKELGVARKTISQSMTEEDKVRLDFFQQLTCLQKRQESERMKRWKSLWFNDFQPLGARIRHWPCWRVNLALQTLTTFYVPPSYCVHDWLMQTGTRVWQRLQMLLTGPHCMWMAGWMHVCSVISWLKGC